MNSRLAKHQGALDRLCDRDRLRRLETRSGLDFSSNDYLALSTAPELRAAAADALSRGVDVGSGGSRLLRGNDGEHQALEEEAAAFFRVEKALFFGGGFNANMAIFATLPQQGDLIVYDKLIHASAHDGMKLGAADCVAFAHNDPQSADDVVGSWRASGGTGRIWLAFESLYSMDGDLAPVDDLVAVAERHDGFALIDEAHATGVFGQDGRGYAADFDGKENIVTLHTCGKALGASGALVCGASAFADYLVNRARGFIYATAPSPLIAAVVRSALLLLKEQPERQKRLKDLIVHANREVGRICGHKPSGTQIIPIIVGDDRQTMDLSARMRARGFDIRGIRPPTVPRGSARLRIAVTLHNDASTVTAMCEVLNEELGKLAA